MITNLKSDERLDDLQIEWVRDHTASWGSSVLEWMPYYLPTFCLCKTERMCAGSWNRNRDHSHFTYSKDRRMHFTGLEIQEESADMARRSVVHNHLEEKVDIVTGDIKEAAELFGPASFDVITTNPPYMIGHHGIENPSDAKAIARHEVLCDLNDILRESARILKPRGRFYMVHRPFRLAEILSKMIQVGIEPKRMRMVHPFVHKEPNMVLIEGIAWGKFTYARGAAIDCL
mgnify:CR=1 FL=1